MALAEKLTPLAAEGFMRDLSNGEAYRMMFADVYDHAIGCQRISVYRDVNGQALAFIASVMKQFNDTDIYHLEGIVLVSEVQGNGFAHGILRQELIENNADILAFHTQSELMKRLGERVAMFNPDLARDVAGLIGTGNLLDLPDGPIDRMRYGGTSLYGDIETFDSVAIKDSGFNYLEGDAIIFAGFVK
jgi:hypothetical protein